MSSSRSRVVLAVVVVAGALGALLWFGTQNDTSSSIHGPKIAALRHVVYEVEGTATQADLTFQTASGGSSQQQAVDVPVVKKKDHTPGIEGDFPAGAFLYMAAQNHNDSGTITCRIKVDGVVVAENTSSGGFTIATCSSSA